MEKVSIELTPYEDENLLFKRASKILKVKEDEIKIFKKSIDARHKDKIKIIYQVGVKEGITPQYESVKTDRKIAIVGCGPAGLFCALTLIKYGIKPIIFERGSKVEERKKAIDNFILTGNLNTNSNIQFGEGGAGTFSDGKLNTQLNNDKIIGVLNDFVNFGAPSDILYLSKPHIGSDKLPNVIKNIREYIISKGGQFLFDTCVTDFDFNGDKVNSVTANGIKYDVDDLVLAVGHSSRDTFKVLYSKNIKMEQKEFAVGLRIEQLQELIDKDRYGKFAGTKTLPPADYKLVSHLGERDVFTFCMCPGGEVVPSSSEEGHLVVNGMSNYLRDGINANSAVIAQVKLEDFPNNSPLAGIDFQREIESKAYNIFGDYIAPIELATDFINGTKSNKLQGVLPTYKRGYDFYKLEDLFPKKIADSLKIGIKDMDNKLKGFGSLGAVLTGVETRTSSPLRILRNEFFESVTIKNLYPCGEGCGYAGGIMSAATDGVKVAHAIIDKIKNAQ